MNNPLSNTNTKLKNTKFKLLVWISLIFVSIGGVLISGFPALAQGAEASLFLQPSSGEYQIGSTFSVKVKVDSNGAPINAAQAKILFPQEVLEVESVSKRESIFKLWPEEPVFSNSEGEISFKGGVPAPGFIGEGIILTVNFKAKKVGEAKVSLSEAAVLAADGKGTNILGFLQGAAFLIVKVPNLPRISSPTHPNENFWYRNSNPEFQWEISPDIIGISYKFDQNHSSIPEVISEEMVNSKSFKGLEDGIRHFHLRVQNKAGWSETSHYKVQIDTTPPYPFDVVIDNQGDPTNPRPSLYFEAKDDLSGISHYTMKISEGDTFSLTLGETNPFQLPHQAPGSHKILVKAIDQAGNFRESSTLLNVKSIPIPEILIYPRTYTAGEELFYVEGITPPNLTAIIYFKKNEKTIKIWEAESDKNGIWSLSTNKLFKSGNYLIAARSKDPRGAISNPSPEYPIEVILAGISIGSLLITYRSLFSALIILFVLVTIITSYLILSKKRKIEKETQEAAESLKNTFAELKKKVTKKIEYLDSKPGLNLEEEKLRDELIEILEKSEQMVRKEIEDIKKQLK